MCWREKGRSGAEEHKTFQVEIGRDHLGGVVIGNRGKGVGQLGEGMRVMEGIDVKLS